MAIAISTDPALLAAHKRRLRELQLRAAKQGYATPAEVQTEIEEITAVLKEAEPEPTTEAGRYAALSQRVDDLALLQHETRQDVRRLFWLLPILMLLFVIVLAVLR